MDKMINRSDVAGSSAAASQYREWWTLGQGTEPQDKGQLQGARGIWDKE